MQQRMAIEHEEQAIRRCRRNPPTAAGPAATLVTCPTRSTPLKERLRSDLTTAMKARDKVRSGTIRMVLTAISQAEVAGDQAVELTEPQVLEVVVREAKKRREAEEAYTDAGRAELAEKEQAEAAVLTDYLPQQLTPTSWIGSSPCDRSRPARPSSE